MNDCFCISFLLLLFIANHLHPNYSYSISNSVKNTMKTNVILSKTTAKKADRCREVMEVWVRYDSGYFNNHRGTFLAHSDSAGRTPVCSGAGLQRLSAKKRMRQKREKIGTPP